MKHKLFRVLRLPLVALQDASESTGHSLSSPEPLRPRVEFAAGRNRHRSRAGEIPMKRLMLLPVLALALAACGEAPTAPLARPGVSQFDQLADPNSGLAFVEDEEGETTTTRCGRITRTEATCTFDITGAGFREIYVTSHVEFVWYYECVTKKGKIITSGVVFETTNESGIFTGDPITESFTHTATQPTDNPCPRKGKPTLHWGIGLRDWFVYADDSGYDNEPRTMWICKSSDGTCR